MRFTDFRIRVPWGNLSVRHWGPSYTDANVQRVILTHGIKSTKKTWDFVANELAEKNISVIGFDLPGHGESSFPVMFPKF